METSVVAVYVREGKTATERDTHGTTISHEEGELAYLQLVFQYRHFFIWSWAKLSPHSRIPAHKNRVVHTPQKKQDSLIPRSSWVRG